MVALSPDGQHLAWIVSHKDKTRLMLASGSGQNAHAVTIPGACKEEGLRWAPNRDELAVLTRCKVDPSKTKPIHGAIWLLDAQAGSPPHKISDLKGFASGMQWTHSGKTIAFLYVPGATRLPEATASGNPRVGVIGEHDVQVERVAEISAAGGAPVNATSGTRVTPSWFKFLSPGRLLVSQFASGKIQVAEYTLSNNVARQARVLFGVPGVIGDGSAALAVSVSENKQHRRVAYSQNSLQHAPEVHVGRLAKQSAPAVTTINAGLRKDWGKARSVEWSDGGLQVQGWLIYPTNYDPHKHYPMIVYVHGGPSWMNVPTWGDSAAALSSFGYFVLMPNPRGSFGEGEKFAQAIRGQMGYGDLHDILAGVDKVEKLVPVDNNRLGMMGWSYGGFMSMFAPTQTNRFKAVVAGAGLSDWKSYYGENQIDGWMIPFFGASLYEDPKAYSKSSAINFITQDHTPALIVVGQRDEEVPAPQSFEYWHALKTLGVPTTLVVYANQGHHIVNLKDQEDILRRTLDWFGKYLAAPAKKQ